MQGLVANLVSNFGSKSALEGFHMAQAAIYRPWNLNWISFGGVHFCFKELSKQ